MKNKFFVLFEFPPSKEKEKAMASGADIGLVGLAVMGENLALNILNHDFSIAVCMLSLFSSIIQSLFLLFVSDFSWIFFHLRQSDDFACE